MEVVRSSSLEIFRARAERLLVQSEVQNNLMLSIVEGMGALSTEAYLATVEDCGCAGRAFCCLYADLSSLTANHVYRTIGYRPISSWRRYVLSSRKA